MIHLECRGTAKVRKDEIESLSMQLLREKGQVSFFLSKNHVLYKLHQVSSLKYEVDTRKKTTKDLEGKLVSFSLDHHLKKRGTQQDIAL